MSLYKRRIKIQFKIDQLNFYNRIGILCGSLLTIIGIWFFLVYSPQTHQSARVKLQVTELNNKTLNLLERNKTILRHVTSHDLDHIILEYKKLEQKIHLLEQNLLRYRNRYVSDRVLGKLLYALLVDVKHLTITNFSTMVTTPLVTAPKDQQQTKVITEEIKEQIKKSNKPTINPLALNFSKNTSEMTHYTLTINGNYFDILNYLQRIEQLKWQLFWEKLTYQVKRYPQASATIKFYTLKEQSNT